MPLAAYVRRSMESGAFASSKSAFHISGMKASFSSQGCQHRGAYFMLVIPRALN